MTLALRRPLVAVFAFLMFVAMVGLAQPAVAACAQDNTKTTSSTSSSTYGASAYWTTSNTYTGGSPCVDINVINQNRSTSVIGSWKGSGIWHIGDPGWVFGPQYELVEVVLDITPSGVPFRTGSAVGSTVQRQLS